MAALATLAVIFTCGCSGGNSASTGSQSQEAEQQSGAVTYGAWTLGVSTDEFGDVISDGHTFISSDFTGTFANTATTGSDFSGTVTIFWSQDEKYKDGGSYLVAFDMVEYGNTPFTYLDSDITLGNKLKTKSSSGEKNEYGVGGKAPDTSLVVYGGGLGGGDFVKSLINETGEMRCILNFGSTTFDFNLDCNGFANAFAAFDDEISEAMDNMKAKAEEEEAEAEAEAAARLDAAMSHSDAEAMENIKLYEDPNKKNHYAAMYLFEHVDEYETLGQSEIEALFPGTYAWQHIRANSAEPNAVGGSYLDSGTTIFTFDGDGTYRDVASQTGPDTFKTIDLTSLEHPYLYSVEGDRLVRKSWSSSENSYQTSHTYELRKVGDGFYLAIEDGSTVEMRVMRPVDIESLGI